MYRKTHLWDREVEFFTPEFDPAPVVETAVGRIGIVICYDLEFPEMIRPVALRGADLLAVPTNWPWVDRPVGQPAPEVVIAMAAARVNAWPSRAATGVAASAASAGTRRAPSSAPTAGRWRSRARGGLAVAEVDLSASRDKKISVRNDVLRDRRTDVYR